MLNNCSFKYTFLIVILVTLYSSCSVVPGNQGNNTYSLPENIVLIVNDTLIIRPWNSTLQVSDSNVVIFERNKPLNIKAESTEGEKLEDSLQLSWSIGGKSYSNSEVQITPEDDVVFISLKLSGRNNKEINKIFIYKIILSENSPGAPAERVQNQEQKSTVTVKKDPPVSRREKEVSTSSPAEPNIKVICPEGNKSYKIFDHNRCNEYKHRDKWISTLQSSDCWFEITKLHFFIDDSDQIGTQYYNFKVTEGGKSVYNSGNKLILYKTNTISIPSGILLEANKEYNFILEWVQQSGSNMAIKKPKWLSADGCGRSQINQDMSFSNDDIPFYRIDYSYVQNPNSL